MKMIWKFRLKMVDRQGVMMPGGAKILCIQVQHGEPQLWALVDPEAVGEVRTFAIYGTGHVIDGAGEYLDTYQLHGGGLIFHVFEVTG